MRALQNRGHKFCLVRHLVLYLICDVVLPTLFNVVNNTEQVVEPESSLQSGVTMLNNIVDNLEQCGQQNIVQCCFHQARTGCAFFAVYMAKN